MVSKIQFGDLPEEFYIPPPIRCYKDQLISPDGLPYYEDLVRVREALNEFGFPNGKCHLSSRLVHLVTGLEEIGGRYSPFLENGKRYNVCPHFWDYDSERGLYIDLAQDQDTMVPSLPNIVVLLEDTFVLTPLPETTRAQKMFGLEFLEKLAEELR